MDRAFTAAPTFVIYVELNEGSEALLQEYGPNLVFSRFQTIEHLISDNRKTVAGEIIINE